ncbi:MAG: hypothetical protein GXO86_13380, partial [Chlorobi bacterium]|nr:hypothetical protein [Chlorobiota bacterium]
FNIGLFNGYGIKEYRYNNSGIMATQNLSYRIPFKHSSLQFGYSVMYRKAGNLYLPGIEPDTAFYSGDEFSFDVNGLFKSKVVDIQAEYLQANIDKATANGYYTLVTIKINAKNQTYFVFDNYRKGYESKLNGSWYITGYNYLFKKYDIMLTLETGFQETEEKWNNRTVLQFQMFFH